MKIMSIANGMDIEVEVISGRFITSEVVEYYDPVTISIIVTLQYIWLGC